MKYKTQEIENLMNYISESYPCIREELMKLADEAADIELGICARGSECVAHDILLCTGEKVCLFWEVEYLVNYSLMQPERLRMGSPYEIMNTVERGGFSIVHKHNTGNVVRTYNGNRGTVIKHDISYMIVASLPFLGVKCVMDGCYGFYDAMLENRSVRYFAITGDECMLFLQPQSRQFVELCTKIEVIVEKAFDMIWGKSMMSDIP